VAATGKERKVVEGVFDFGGYAVSGGEVVGGDLFPDVVNIGFRFRVKRIPGHELGFALRAALLARRRANTS